MNTELLVGVIGLLGALVGAAAAFAGVVYQQNHQARLARAERREALARQAVDVLMAELEDLRKLLSSGPDIGPADSPQFLEPLERHLSVINLAALRLPQEELRELIESACNVRFGYDESYREWLGIPPGQGHEAYQRESRLSAMCRDAQRCLGAYLRQEPHHAGSLYLVREYFEEVNEPWWVRGEPPPEDPP